MILVRATISLKGLSVGDVVWVDPENAYVQDAIAAGVLVVVEH